MVSLQRHHPDWDRFVLLVGEPEASDRSEASFTTVSLEALSLPSPRQFCFRYTLLELNTAVKPWMFACLFERGYDRVIYFDPDIFVYSALAEVDVDPSETFLVLTPHLTGSIGGDEHPSERSILQTGTYNLGFLALSRRPSLANFLSWWQKKLEFQCVVDTARGLFVDQRWMDLAPGLFPDVAILRHDGYNVAYWNLRQRTVTRHGASATVNGQPLRFFHFSGFDPAYPDRVSRHAHRLKLADVGDAEKLFRDYAAALRVADFECFRNAPYAFDVFADGTPISDGDRIAYRNSAALQTACGANPFEHPELFRTSVGARAYEILSRARPVMRIVPPQLRTPVREFLLRHR